MLAANKALHALPPKLVFSSMMEAAFRLALSQPISVSIGQKGTQSFAIGIGGDANKAIFLDTAGETLSPVLRRGLRRFS